MSTEGNIHIGLNTEKLDRDIETTERKLQKLTQKVTNVARKGFNTVVVLGEMTGMAIDQSYQLMAQAAFIAAETVAEIAAAESLTIVGAINAGLALSAASLLMIQGVRINNARSNATVQIQGLISLANEWRF